MPVSKRKQRALDEDGDVDLEDDSSDVSMINVDFDFFDPNPEIDYSALKNLLRQTFQLDAETVHINELADLILSQPLLGTTVKTDGKEGDPLAVLSVLNMHVHKDHPSIKALTEYVLSKSTSSADAHNALQSLLGPEASEPGENHVGYIFSERLVNMPVQVIPHMYRMLADEIRMAVEDNEPYTFSHYLFLTRVYRLSAEEAAALDESANAIPSKKRKKGPIHPGAQSVTGAGTYSFHPEDECIQKVAAFTLDYPHTTSPPRGEEAMGPELGGRMMLVPAERFQELIDMMIQEYAPS